MKIVLDKIQQFNLKLILDNKYPLDGFMNQKKYNLVLNNKSIFPIPICLQIEEDKFLEIKDCKEVILCNEYNTFLGKMIISDFYKPDIEKEYELYTKKFKNYFYYYGDNYYHVGGNVQLIDNKTKINNEISEKKLKKSIVLTYPYDTNSERYNKYRNNLNSQFIDFSYTEDDIIKEKLENLKHLVFRNNYINLKQNTIEKNKKGVCLWFIGLSASGKTTLADAVKDRLLKMNPDRKIVHIDGDKNVNILFKQYSLSEQTKPKNRNWGTMLTSYRVSEFIKDSDTIVIVTTTTPFYKPRLYNKWLIEKYGKYIEILMDTPLDICKKRDPKNLYKKVENGEIKSFVGIHQPFEKENTSNIIIKDFDIDKNINTIIQHM